LSDLLLRVGVFGGGDVGAEADDRLLAGQVRGRQSPSSHGLNQLEHLAVLVGIRRVTYPVPRDKEN
jgi:hypothetical protein